MTRPATGPLLDVLVIGGGQAGLVMGYHLTQRGHHFQIVDAGAEIGQAWRSRWDSLRLFTPARYDNLPGLPFPASPDTYPGKDAVADYLRAYAARFQLPVRLDTTVTSLTGSAGGYVAKAGGQAWEARQVVVATGPFQVPFVPPVAARLGPEVVQIHSVDYRNPTAVPPGRVLVVGAANSGCQIAEELSATHQVELSVGRRLPVIPQRPLGRDVWTWASAVRLDRVNVTSRLGRRLAGRDVGDRRRAAATGPPARRPDSPAGYQRNRSDRDIRRRQRRRLRRGGVGDRVHHRPLLDRRSQRERRAWRHPAHPWRDARARSLPARPDLAAHPRLRAARVGACRRRLPRGADRVP